MTRVSITQDQSSIERAITEALDHLDLDDLIHNRVVAVHPNDTWASAEDTTAITQPDTLRAVLKHLKHFGPRQLIVSGGSGAAETDELFELTGLMDVVREENAIFFDHNRPPFTEVRLDYGSDHEVIGPQESVMVNPRVLEYETLVALNQLKVHETATITLGLKNIAMSFPAADYYGHPRGDEKHTHHFFEDMHSFIAAMAKRFPAQLSITAGHPAMIGMGPIGGHVVESGIVIASTDFLAADVVGARLLGFSCQAVRHLWEAAKLGLGETETERMSFPVLDIDEGFAAFTQAAYGHSLQLEHA